MKYIRCSLDWKKNSCIYKSCEMMTVAKNMLIFCWICQNFCTSC